MEDHILLIWEENPEEIRFYAIPKNEADAEWYVLRESNGVMVNESGKNDEYAAKLNGFVMPAWSQDWTVPGGKSSVVHPDGKWVQFRIEVSELPSRQFVAVYKSGFFL